MANLGYLPKLKRGMALAFGSHFLHDFFIKVFLISYTINGQSFNVVPFLRLKIWNKVNKTFRFTTKKSENKNLS